MSIQTITIILTLYGLMALTPLMSAGNAFVDGTVWEMVSRSSDPFIEPGHYKYEIDGVPEVGGYEALQLFEDWSADNAKFVAFVRTEGDKVYFAWDE